MTKTEKLIKKEVEENFYTLDEAAKRLGMVEQSLRNAISHGNIKATKILNTTTISKAELAKQLALRGRL